MTASRPPGRNTSIAPCTPSLDSLQLSIRLHPDGLEGPGRRVGLPPRLPAHGLPHDIGKLYGVLDGPRPDDGPRDPPRLPLLAEPVDQVREVLLAVLVHDVVRRKLLAPVEAHVQGTRAQEAESPGPALHLERREPEIEQHPVRWHEAVCFRQPFQLPIAPLYEGRAPAKSPSRRRQCLFVHVQSQQSRRRVSRHPHLSAVTALADGAVDVSAAGLDIQRIQHLLYHHRSMARLHHTHRPPHISCPDSTARKP